MAACQPADEVIVAMSGVGCPKFSRKPGRAGASKASSGHSNPGLTHRGARLLNMHPAAWNTSHLAKATVGYHASDDRVVVGAGRDCQVPATLRDNGCEIGYHGQQTMLAQLIASHQ